MIFMAKWNGSFWNEDPSFLSTFLNFNIVFVRSFLIKSSTIQIAVFTLSTSTLFTFSLLNCSDCFVKNGLARAEIDGTRRRQWKEKRGWGDQDSEAQGCSRREGWYGEFHLISSKFYNYLTLERRGREAPGWFELAGWAFEWAQSVALFAGVGVHA